VLDGAPLATLTPADDEPAAEGLIPRTLTMAAGDMTHTLQGTLDEPPLNLARELATSFAGLDNE
jgi:hypothetical protein